MRIRYLTLIQSNKIIIPLIEDIQNGDVILVTIEKICIEDALKQKIKKEKIILF